MKRILAIHTSTHAPEKSSSTALTRAALDVLGELHPGVKTKWIDAAAIYIAPNLSCYANGKTHCADPASGPYRCWANVNAKGKDEMPLIYDALAWADTVIFTTSTRWGSHSAVAQNVIERMNTLENRGSSYGEPFPLKGKRLGVIATGLHWHTGDVARRLRETLEWWGFASQADESNVLAWQRSRDPYFEHPDNDKPYVERWTLTPQGEEAVRSFAHGVATANHFVPLRPR
jgi:multimeric flavodoxin WrbA